MRLGANLREFAWAAPFLSAAFISLTLSRPSPQFPVLSPSRIVTDASGVKVPIALPFRGVVFTWCGFGPGAYLEHAHSSGTLSNVGSQKDRERFADNIYGRAFPEVVAKGSLWDGRIVDGHGGLKTHYGDIEHIMAYDGGAYLGDCGGYGVVQLLRDVGLPSLFLMWHEKNWDESLFASARVETALIDEPQRGEALIAAYKQRYADLDAELQTKTLLERPRILIMGSHTARGRNLYVKNERNAYQIYLPPAGVVNAAGRNVAQGPDTERILLMDPDYIFLMGGGQPPEEFKQDPRWRGLQAVRNNRVYRMPGSRVAHAPGVPADGGGLAGLHFQPLWVRWMAEIAHPDRLQPKLRGLLRAHFDQEFGYRLSDDELDEMLHIDVNKDSEGYARFMKRAEGASQ